MIPKTATPFEQCGERGIALSKKIAESLKLQLFCAVLISLFSGVAIFGLSFLLGNTLLDKTVYGNSFSEQMADQQFSMLQDYVEEEKISLGNLQRLNAWCSRGEKVYLTIYHDGILVYESPVSGKTHTELPVQEYDLSEEDTDSKYTLTLSDDVTVRAFLYYYAGDAFYFWMTIISGLFAFVAFSLCFVVLIGRKVSYVAKLKEELDILSGGQLEYPVTIIGRDELGELALGIDQMRRSIIRHQDAESKMRSANSELITAMSHDLRTPLTSLLAYLEIIERKKYKNEQQMEELIHKSVGQTMRIKQMADKLFAYFWAYATEWEAVEMETVDADGLFQQILGDYAYALESKGMSVKTDFAQTNAKIRINAELLQRALDNLYSNLLKYAAPKSSVQFSLKRQENNLLLSISNVVRSNREQSESTGIGLITCRRIIEYHGGSFTADEIGRCFYVTISIPICE